jgi:hypothetical protein
MKRRGMQDTRCWLLDARSIREVLVLQKVHGINLVL